MDGLAALLDGPRARGAFLLRCLMDPPWSVRLQDEAPLSLTAVVRGGMWVVPDDAAPFHVGAGDLLVATGPEPWTIADEVDTPVQAVIHPGQHCTTPEGRSLEEEMHQGVRSWGNSSTGEAVLLTGAYLLEGEVSRRLLRALPRFVVLGEADLDSPLLPLLAHEIGRDEPGQQAVLDRLLDLLLIAVLRAWFARPEADPPAWYAGQSDPVVGPALRLLQHHPEHPWSVAELATAGGVSRAAFARRFADVVGEPPMAFLTGWRLALAADLLREPDVTLAAVARRVGYSTPFALSAAFKRLYGVSPREHRAEPA
ncbi:AraC family transcriptional regulator [Nocardioides sp. T2.26MG-1]|uniref:AraC family transcriptional regulator n=1 Tax=Nocardioides sp. T2.26MG-1 TaxID=3041166 RepID=UPI002477919B|nr:AraC family transcriptional regulator [Nocardioides sp. T2.26MG-1]CAI9412200.1 IS5 family transposase IS4811 [Nocardioides sp. T2.26MG-1]